MVCGGLERPLSRFFFKKKSLGEVPILSQKNTTALFACEVEFIFYGCAPSLDRFDKNVRQVENVYLATSCQDFIRNHRLFLYENPDQRGEAKIADAPVWMRWLCFVKTALKTNYFCPKIQLNS